MMPLLVSELTAKLIMPFLCAFGTHTYKKEKPCPLGRKTGLACEYDMVQAPTKRGYATTFRAPSMVFTPLSVSPLAGSRNV